MRKRITQQWISSSCTASAPRGIGHHLPGRLRLRARMGLAASGLIGALDGLRETSGIDRVTVNPATGSVLVGYDSASLPPALVQGLFEARDAEGFRRLALTLWPDTEAEEGASR